MPDTRKPQTLAPGDRLEVEAAELVAGGDALARVDGFPLFVPGLYPRDRAAVVVTEVKKGFGRAEVVTLLEPSPLRREISCPAAAECGGCDWTSLRLDAQLEAKEHILRDSLRRIGKFDAASLPELRIHPSPLNYRLRSRIHVAEGLPRAIGFYAAKSNRVVPLPAECEVVGPNLLALREELATSGLAEPGSSLETIETGDELVASRVGDEGEEALLRVRGFQYRVSTAGFFQVNRHLLPTLIDLVVEAAGRARWKKAAIDLYAGAGFFTLPLARLFETVYSVESSRLSSHYASINARPFRNVKVRRATAESFLAHPPREVDFVMIDPPRAGAAPEVLDAIDGTAAEMICYLSCDPVTFSRDANRLARRGWRLTHLHLVDLFPNTHHIETFSSFERAS